MARLVVWCCATILLSLVLVDLFTEASKVDISWHWGQRAFDVCTAKGKKLPKGSCSILRDVVEEGFDKLASYFATIVEITSVTEMQERGETEPWKGAAMNHLHELVRWMRKNDPKDTEKLSQEFQSKFLGWLLKLASGDTNGIGGFPPGFNPSNMPEGFDPSRFTGGGRGEEDEEDHDEL